LTTNFPGGTKHKIKQKLNGQISFGILKMMLSHIQATKSIQIALAINEEGGNVHIY